MGTFDFILGVFFCIILFDLFRGLTALLEKYLIRLFDQGNKARDLKENIRRLEINVRRLEEALETIRKKSSNNSKPQGNEKNDLGNI